MATRRAATVAGGCVLVASLTIAGGAALYYAWLPANPGPDNSSPPPEAVGLTVGALLGCGLAVGALALVLRSAEAAMQSFGIALTASSLFWLVLGSGSFGGRILDCVLAIVVCSLGAGFGVAAGIGGAGILDVARRRRTKPT